MSELAVPTVTQQILIVSNELATRTSYKRVLSCENYDILTATEEEALDVVNDLDPEHKTIIISSSVDLIVKLLEYNTNCENILIMDDDCLAKRYLKKIDCDPAFLIQSVLTMPVTINKLRNAVARLEH